MRERRAAIWKPGVRLSQLKSLLKPQLLPLPAVTLYYAIYRAYSHWRSLKVCTHGSTACLCVQQTQALSLFLSP